MDINFENFSKFNIVVGTIVNAELNIKAIKPAYVLNIDFGNKIGIKKTSAQITNYNFTDLLGRQVIAVTNFPAKKIAGTTSEVLVLAAVNSEGAHLLKLDKHIENGTYVS